VSIVKILADEIRKSMKPSLFSIFAAAAALPAARAWGTAGSFELVTPPPPNAFAPTSTTWHHSAACGGAVFTAGTDADTGRQTVYGLDTASFAWVRYQDLPLNFFAPTIFCSGGLLLASGGASDAGSNMVAIMPLSMGRNASWTLTVLKRDIGARDGHRHVEYGGVLYAIGGLDSPGSAKAKWSNVVFALDVASYVLNDSNSSTVGFVKLIPAQQPGLFAPRGAFSVDVYGNHIVLFGGLTRSATLSPFPGCAAPGAACVAFNDLWRWAPGLPDAPLSTSTCSGTCGWELVQVTGAPPSPRFGHASGIMLNNLYIFGGSSAAGDYLQDMYVFSLTSNAWTSVSVTPPSYALPAQRWLPSGGVIADRFYLLLTGLNETNAIVRFTPQLA